MKIWYDISGLYNWQGTFTGIQRVVYSLGKCLDEDNNCESGFFIFQHGNFLEVSWEDLEHRLEQNGSDRSHVNDRSKVHLAQLRHHSILRAKKLATSSALEKPLRGLYEGLRKAHRYTKRKSRNHVAQCPFRHNDTVIVVDGNWLFPGFAESIKATKDQIDYTFTHVVNDIVAIKNPALASDGADKVIGAYFKKILPFADTVLCISESTKNDVLVILAEYVKNADVRTIELGSDIQSVVSVQKPDLEISEEFILAVSTVEVRKNYLLMYYIYKKSLADSIDLPNLIIVGKKGWAADDTYRLITKDPEVNKKITIVSGVTDAELEWLYSNCKFTVFPSFYEGWGIPVAESLSRGKVCVSSNTSSMPEVGKDLVVYASPYDTQQWIDVIKSLSSKKLSRIEDKIKHEYKSVLWQDTYGDLMRSIGDCDSKSV